MLSERLTSAREAAGLSQAQLANRVGVKRVTVSHWEADRTAPRANRLNQLAGLLNVPVLWLLGGAECPLELQGPAVAETARVEHKLQRAESLLRELNELVGSIRKDLHWIQSELNDTDVES